MNKVFDRISNSYCPICNQDYLIELYETNDRPIGYRAICRYNKLDELNKILNRVELSYCKCIRCKTKFIIDWRYGYPKPYIKI